MNTGNVMVSVIMITYNHEQYIQQAIEGVLMQQCDFAYELVIGEDCSTDSTRVICEKFTKQHPGIIRLLPSTRKYGMMSNFIRTLNACSGKYIAMCEGDDYWTDAIKLQKQVDFLESNIQYSICFTYSEKVDLNGNVLDLAPVELKRIVYNQFDFLIGNKLQTRTCTILARSNVFKDLPNYILKSNAGDSWVKIHATKSSSGIVLPFISASYRIHSGGVWSSLNRNNLHRKQYLDWKSKFWYSIVHNKKASVIIFQKMVGSYIKWRLLRLWDMT